MKTLESLLEDNLGAWAAQVASSFVQRRVETGQLLFREGASLTDDGLVLVLEGAVQIEAEQPEGGFAVVKQAGPGHVLGVLGLLDESPRSATCRASAPSLVAQLPRTDFMRLYEDRTALGLSFLSWLARQMVEDVRTLDTILRHAVIAEES